MRILFLTSDLDITNGWGRYSAGFLAQARERNGTASIVVPDPKRLRSKAIGWRQALVAPIDAWRLRESARGVELMHVATEPLLPLAFFLSSLTRVPYVASVHGTYGDLRSYSASIRWLYRLAFARAARIVAVSRYTADVMRRQFPRAKIDVVPGGFALPEPASRKEAPGAEPRVLAVGAIKPRKGFHTLVEALGILDGEGVSFRADCVGPKDPTAYVEHIEKRVTELSLGGRVRLTGRVSETDLRRSYAEADVFVLPSEHDGPAFEGLGLAYLEALARGLPAIGCLDSGAEDVIQDGVNGFLVPPGNPERLAAAIGRVLTDQALWKKMSDAAPRSVERFRWETVGAEMDAAYTTAISEYAR